MMNKNFNIAEVIMVYGPLHTGGIDTLIIRIANHLAQNDCKVSVYFMDGGDLQNYFDGGVNRYVYANASELMGFVKLNHGTRPSIQATLILSFDSSSAVKGELIELAIAGQSKAVHVTGIFHPMWYFMPGQPLDRKKLNEWLALSIGPENIFFMNEECRAMHAAQWRIDLSASPIIPLPVDYRPRQWQPSAGSPLRVVSVGRFVDFKAYNLGAPHIVRECLNRGCEVIWDIYGYGPQEQEIQKLVESLEVTRNVRLMGKLDYAAFGATVAQYDIFVGMGTSVIESAMVGVPSICAAVDELNRSYGFVSELPFGNVGEIIAGRQMIEIGEMMRAYGDLSIESKMALSEREIAVAHRYNLPSFIDSLFCMALTRSMPRNRIARHFVARLFYELTDGFVAKKFLRKGLKRKFLQVIGR